jgi:hypothetical protein
LARARWGNTKAVNLVREVVKHRDELDEELRAELRAALQPDDGTEGDRP